MKLSSLARAAAAAALGGVVTAGAIAQGTNLTEWDIHTQAGISKILQSAQQRFEQAHPGVSVQRTSMANDAYKTKLKIAFGANEPPCVFMTWGGGLLGEYVRAGQVLDLTPYLAKEQALRDRYLPTAFGPTTFKGKTYGIPGENTAAAVVFYNKEMFKKFGLTPPKTWEELLQVIDALKANKVAPFALANKTKWPGSMYFMYLVERLGGAEAFRKAVERAPGGSFADPVFIEAGKRLQDLVRAGAFAQGFNGLEYDAAASRRLMYAGKAAMEVMGTWSIALMRGENPGFAKKVDFFPFPAIAGSNASTTSLLGSVGQNFYSISSACKTPDLAFDLIKTMFDEQAVADRLADNRLVPLKHLPITDPALKRLMGLITEASSVQLWYDQELPPQLGEMHKDTVQALFGLSMTPEEAANKMEELAAKVLR